MRRAAVRADDDPGQPERARQRRVRLDADRYTRPDGSPERRGGRHARARRHAAGPGAPGGGGTGRAAVPAGVPASRRAARPRRAARGRVARGRRPAGDAASGEHQRGRQVAGREQTRLAPPR